MRPIMFIDYIYDGIVGVSIIRSGDILLEAVRQIVPGLSVGKILIQRDESTEDKRAIV